MRALGASVVLLLALGAQADELPVPLQVQLLQKTASYITTLAPSESGKVKVLVLYPGATAARGSETLTTALNGVGQVGKFPLEAKLVALGSLRESLVTEKPQVLWVASETDEKGVAQVLEACGPMSILTVSGNAAHVKQGVILGFELVEARPRILVHLKQARAQNVVFLSGLLTHSLIVER